jgi:hypothetical protein
MNWPLTDAELVELCWDLGVGIFLVLIVAFLVFLMCK